MSGFALEFSGCAYPERKKLWIQNYADTGGDADFTTVMLQL